MNTNALERQLGDLTWCIATGLRAGYSLKQTFETLADQAPEPAAQVCQHLLADLEAGQDFEAALANLKQAFPSTALGRLVDVILKQRQTGGNLAELLDLFGDDLVSQAGSDPAFHAVMRQEAEALGATLPKRIISS